MGQNSLVNIQNGVGRGVWGERGDLGVICMGKGGKARSMGEGVEPRGRVMVGGEGGGLGGGEGGVAGVGGLGVRGPVRKGWGGISGCSVEVGAF